MKNLSINNRLNRRKKRRLPLVSVVMPVCNTEKYLPAAIESILNQTYKRLELIIVDDSSTDNSLKIAKSYKRRSRRIRILKTGKNIRRGAEVCANLGIDAARGKYISRTNQDVISSRDRLEKQVEFLQKNKRVLLVGSNAHIINKNGKIIEEILEPTSPSDIYRAYATFNPVIDASVMVRRVFAGEHFSYQIDYETNSDYYTFFKLAAKGYILANIPEKLLFVRREGQDDTYSDIKGKFLVALSIRLSMILHSNYRFTIRDFLINILQAIILFTLPSAIVKSLLSSKRKPLKEKGSNIDFLKPFVAPLPI